ncbi:MAG: saccharopine dehydrogenase C-terminal domain-containing protein [Acidobacteriota bacterium]
MHIAILGAGRVGAAMARDLAASDNELVIVDAAEAALDALADLDAERRRVDLTTEGALEGAIAEAQLVVGAVPGPLGFAVARRVIEAGKHLVDISFFAEDASALDELARSRGVVCLVDCGIAPGVSNLVVGRAEAQFARVDRFVCYVGGLPVERRLPWQYTAPFSPIDVLAEYTRPARLVEGGEIVERPALSGVEHLDLPGVGTLEAFETDGLRTLLHSSSIPELAEKTLRYPGHRDQVALLRDVGLLSEQPLELADGTSVRPLDVAAALLFPQWRPRLDAEGRPERELTVMRCVVDSLDENSVVENDVVENGDVEEASGAATRWTLDLIDHGDPETGTSSMARTTGYTCIAIARAVADGAWTRPGVAAPEALGADEALFTRILGDLEARGIQIRQTHERMEL